MAGTARVWAPRVAKVDLVIGDESTPDGRRGRRLVVGGTARH